MKPLILIAALVMSSPAVAHAHSWYPYECCSDNDCKPVPNASIHETRAGYVIDGNEETVPFSDKRIRQSQDDNSHICTIGGRADGRILCVFVRPNSF